MWRRIHLCSGLLERDGRLLLVGNRYPNQPGLLWNLPGGRQESREATAAAAIREFREETGLAVSVRDLAYVAESIDSTSETAFTAFCFHVDGRGEPQPPALDAHVRACGWYPRDALPRILTVRVVREPLLAHLADPARRYFDCGEAGITIAFVDEQPPAPGPTPHDTSGTGPRRPSVPE